MTETSKASPDCGVLLRIYDYSPVTCGRYPFRGPSFEQKFFTPSEAGKYRRRHFPRLVGVIHRADNKAFIELC